MHSKQYRSMIYSAVATIHFYSKDVEVSEGMTVGDFIEDNPGIVKFIGEEIENIFEYKLSMNQINKAILAYMTATLYPKSIKENLPYKLKSV